jgi:hypothetical protein
VDATLGGRQGSADAGDADGDDVGGDGNGGLLRGAGAEAEADARRGGRTRALTGRVRGAARFDTRGCGESQSSLNPSYTLLQSISGEGACDVGEQLVVFPKNGLADLAVESSGVSAGDVGSIQADC